MPDAQRELERLIDEWFAREVDRYWKLFARGGFAAALYPEGADYEERRELDRHYFREDAERTIDRLSEEYAKGDYLSGVAGAREIAAGLATPPTTDSQDFAILTKRVVEAQAAIEEARIRWAEGAIEYRPTRPGTASAATADVVPSEVATAPPSSRTLGEAIDLYLDLQRRRTKATARGITQRRGELRVLLDAFGADTPVSAVTAQMAGRVYEALQLLPKNFRNTPQLAGLSFFDMVDAARNLDLKPLNGRTINGYLSTMRALFDQERNAGHIKDNPFGRLHVKIAPSHESERGFRPAEIAAIFGSPLFTGSRSLHFAYDPGTVLVADWRFWMPVIALLTGARVSEIAQLRPQDVIEQEGVWLLDFNADDGKRLKTPAARRKVPLHDQLLRLGLPALAKDRAQAGHTLLLPGVPAPVGGDPGKGPSKWMSDKLLRRFRFERRPGIGFHSFRHSMATLLRSANVDGRIADRILGHASTSQGARYGRFDLVTMKKALNSIELPPEINAIPPRVRSAN